MDKEYDVLIAGGGIIACMFARILVDAGFNVVVLEAGDVESDTIGRNHKNYWTHRRNTVHYGHHVKGLMFPSFCTIFKPAFFPKHA
jgi:glycine/D-amino acid oxidase-like deaminating enzyme